MARRNIPTQTAPAPRVPTPQAGAPFGAANPMPPIVRAAWIWPATIRAIIPVRLRIGVVFSLRLSLLMAVIENVDQDEIGANPGIGGEPVAAGPLMGSLQGIFDHHEE